MRFSRSPVPSRRFELSCSLSSVEPREADAGADAPRTCVKPSSPSEAGSPMQNRSGNSAAMTADSLRLLRALKRMHCAMSDACWTRASIARCSPVVAASRHCCSLSRSSALRSASSFRCNSASSCASRSSMLSLVPLCRAFAAKTASSRASASACRGCCASTCSTRVSQSFLSGG